MPQCTMRAFKLQFHKNELKMLALRFSLYGSGNALWWDWMQWRESKEDEKKMKKCKQGVNIVFRGVLFPKFDTPQSSGV